MPLDKNVMEQNLGKLGRLLSAMDEDALTRNEFIEQFQKVIEIVKKTQDNQAQAIAKLQQTYNSLIDRIQKEHSTSLLDLKTGVNELFVGGKLKEMSAKQQELFTDLRKEIDIRIAQKMKAVDSRLSNIKDGKDADETKITYALQGALEAALEKRSVEMSAATEARIEQAEKDLRVRLAPQRGGFKAPRIVLLDFDGDGSAQTFTIDTEPAAKGRAIFLFHNGQWLQPSTHYTYGYKKISLTFIPGSGEKVEGFMFAM
jgi:hypothetical protein